MRSVCPHMEGSVYVLCVWFSLFAMIINLLMGADARTPCGQQGNGDSAT